jgi:hypothetical protein
MSAAFFVLTVLLFIEFRRGLRPNAAVIAALAWLSFLGALFFHESSIVLVPVLVAAWWLLPSDGASQRFAERGTLLMLLVFSITTAAYGMVAYVVNSRSYLVTEGHYAIGTHVFSNVLGALVTFAVARRESIGLAVVGLCFAWALFGSPYRVRFYALWIILALLPAAGFREGFSSRYLYLAAVGFAGLTAELLWWIYEAWPLRSHAAAGLLWSMITIGLLVRFGTFAVKNVQRFHDANAPFSRYAAAIRSVYPSPPRGSTLSVPPPPDTVGERYITALLQWEYRDATLTAGIQK